MSQSTTLTFLFTDIEGSTRLWDSQPELMRTALARHDAILREAIDVGGGLVFKTLGDAFCAAFLDPKGAIEAALQAQLLLAKEDWRQMDPIRVRMALHTGEAECRDEDYFGPPLNRVSRMLTLGHGGQTLLSQSTYSLVAEAVRDMVGFRDLGEHRLKDLQRPEHVFQLVHPKLQESYKPLKSLDTLPNNLPQQVTTFIGRERELREIKRLLSSVRLLTLTGAGGTGKTRLGLQAAVDLLDASGDGSWFVELASISDPALVPQTVAGALSIREEPGRQLMTTLVAHLRTKQILLVLDNAEHLLNAVADLADQIVRQCPHVQILTTSREALSVHGEQTYRVPPLSMPDPAQDYTRDALAQFESVKLFIDRALLSQPTFEITDLNAGAVAQLCHRLDGIPLAIELAAARVRALPVERIAERLNDRFRLLTGGSRTAVPRQQTLRAMIDWSYDLLTTKEMALLRRLSVFSGGWTLDSAEQVCSAQHHTDYAFSTLSSDLESSQRRLPRPSEGEGGVRELQPSPKVDDERSEIPADSKNQTAFIESAEILDLMQSLVDKSLIVYDETIQRYRMSETVRDYGREALAALHESAEVRNRHLAHFESVALDTKSQIAGPHAADALKHLDQDQKNLRAALEWGLSGGDPVSALRTANALLDFFQMRGEYTEASLMYKALLLRISQDANSSDSGHGAHGAVSSPSPLPSAGEVGETIGTTANRERGTNRNSKSPYPSADALSERADALAALGILGFRVAQYSEAKTALHEAIDLFNELDDQFGAARVANTLAVIAILLGNFDEAAGWFETALPVFRQAGDPVPLAKLLNNRAILAINHERDLKSARAYYDEALALNRKTGNRALEAGNLSNFADIYLKEGDPKTARKLAREACDMHLELGDIQNLQDTFERLAPAELALGRPKIAAMLVGTREAVMEKLGVQIAPYVLDEYRQTLAAIRNALGDQEYEKTTAHGRRLTLEEAYQASLQD